ncbi:hypothetical protein D3C77_479480 [compost metagenome]
MALQCFQFLKEPGNLELDLQSRMLDIVYPGNDLCIAERRVQRSYPGQQRLRPVPAGTARQTSTAQQITDPAIDQSLRWTEPAALRTII